MFDLFFSFIGRQQQYLMEILRQREREFREKSQQPPFVDEFKCSPHCNVVRKACCNNRSYPCDRPCPSQCVSRLDLLELCIGNTKCGNEASCCGDVEPQNLMAGAGNGFQKRNGTGIFANGSPVPCEQLACEGSCCMGYANQCAYRCIGGDMVQVIPNQIGSTMTALRLCPIIETWSLCR